MDCKNLTRKNRQCALRTYCYQQKAGETYSTGNTSVTQQCYNHAGFGFRDPYILDFLGLKDTYFARHSFATILKNSGVSTEFISEALGHSSLSTTKNYLAGFEEEAIRRNTDVLVSFMNEAD